MNFSKPMALYKKVVTISTGLLLVVTAGFAVGTDADKAQIDPKLHAAISFRAAMAESVAAAKEYPTAALVRLAKAEELKGLSVEPDADLATAAMDVGHRLVSLGNPAAAEAFFRFADEKLSGLLDKDKAFFGNKERAQYLRFRAHLRGNFLNRPSHARADIDAAIVLQPDDQSLQEARTLLARGHGEDFKVATPRN